MGGSRLKFIGSLSTGRVFFRACLLLVRLSLVVAVFSLLAVVFICFGVP